MNELFKVNRLILASSSPRRQELIAALGLSVPVMMVPSSVDEYVPENWTPIEIVEQLSIRKAEAVGKTLLNQAEVFCPSDHSSNLVQLVIGSDTIVVQDGRVFGKPTNKQHAVEMLQSLQGRSHEVYTGLACAVFPIELEGQTNESRRESITAPARLAGEKLGQTGGYRGELSSVDKWSADAQLRYVGHTCNKVTFREMSDREINDYVASGYPMDKAGAYGIQGIGSVFIERIEGDFYSVMGLPLNLLYMMLSRFGIKIG